jgi:DNA-binding LacI/PurR family transcriptional regulator
MIKNHFREQFGFLLQSLADLGLSVPGDLSVANFDDIRLTNYTVPRLTTVSTIQNKMVAMW